MTADGGCAAIAVVAITATLFLGLFGLDFLPELLLLLLVCLRRRNRYILHFLVRSRRGAIRHGGSFLLLRCCPLFTFLFVPFLWPMLCECVVHVVVLLLRG
jgi:hypothetical protein